jgi:hypothetical protein
MTTLKTKSESLSTSYSMQTDDHSEEDQDRMGINEKDLRKGSKLILRR